MTVPAFLSIRLICLAMLAMPAAAFAQESEEGADTERRSEISPYIEVAQVLQAELSPGDDVVTYSRLAAGVDATISGRNSAAAVSVRYERRIGWGDDAPDGDVISGIARGSLAIVPRDLTFEAGAMATHARVDGGGGVSIGPLADADSESQIYSFYAGPSLTTNAGDVQVEAHYRLGYSRVEAPEVLSVAPGAEPVDVFDDSTVHLANARIGTSPTDGPLPVGVGVGGGYYQEDLSNLDQRVRDTFVRGDVLVPLSPNLALIGGVGYEDVEISSRDAVRDPVTDAPVIGPDGRFVTDESQPRQIAYQTDGLIWDVGVLWRPSRRTSLEAHIGRRYGSTSFYGTLSYAPSSRSSLNIAVYDNVAGFGGQLTNALANLPADFTAFRNPLTGELAGCVVGVESSACLNGVLGSIRSATFRARGVAVAYGRTTGRVTMGIGAGYDRRKFIAAAGTVLAPANGLVDETYWLGANVTYRLDQRSGLSGNIYANWFNSGVDPLGDLSSYGATANYWRNLTEKLSANAAISVDTISRDMLDDLTVASALVGMRYNF
jgi:hypothetical protein